MYVSTSYTRLKAETLFAKKYMNTYSTSRVDKYGRYPRPFFFHQVAPFVPLLLPALARAKDEVSDPECRDVCAKAHAQLELTAKNPPVWKKIEASKVEATIKGLAKGECQM